jgi:molybdopterin-guanine dinucleotide biosynthesis protein A
MPQEPINREKISALVLAGGRSRRMQGRDKGLVTLWGRPLIEHVLDRIRGQVGSIVISANRHSETYAGYGYPVLADEVGPDWGPLAGIYTALRFIDSDYLLVVPCDTPCLPDDLGQRLLAAVGKHGDDIAIAHDGQRPQFTVALISRSLAPDFRDYLERGERRVESWLRQHKVAEVTFADSPHAFVNVNSEDDLEAMEQKGSC